MAEDPRNYTARYDGFAGTDRIYFDGNPQATRAMEKVVGALSARFGVKAPFLDRAVTWNDLGRYGLVRFRMPGGGVMSLKEIDRRSYEPYPFMNEAVATPQLTTLSLTWERDDTGLGESKGEAG